MKRGEIERKEQGKRRSPKIEFVSGGPSKFNGISGLNLSFTLCIFLKATLCAFVLFFLYIG